MRRKWLKIIWRALVGLSYLGLAACSTPGLHSPTTKSPWEAGTPPPLLSEIRWEQSMVIVDARSDFEYSLSRIPGSTRIRWFDFLEPICRTGKGLQSQPQKVARRLALKGIEPKSTVLVVGGGLGGSGEEGWVAWMLYRYGVHDVRFLPIQQVRAKLRPINEELISAVVKNAADWTVQIEESVAARPQDLKDWLAKSVNSSPLWILDVREEKEFHQSPESAWGSARTLNIHWTEFFTRKGQVVVELSKKLEALGVHSGHRIVVVSRDGVASGAVTMALLALGYSEAVNLDGGLEAWRACQPLAFSN